MMAPDPHNDPWCAVHQKNHPWGLDCRSTLRETSSNNNGPQSAEPADVQNPTTPRSDTQACTDCDDGWIYDAEWREHSQCPNPIHRTPKNPTQGEVSEGGRLSTPAKGDTSIPPTPDTQDEHQHGEKCKAVMEIRNTTIDEGIPILEAYATRQSHLYAIAELNAAWRRAPKDEEGRPIHDITVYLANRIIALEAGQEVT